MVVSKNSPKRRKSIAVVDQNEPARPGTRRRAHSVVPSDLSPVAKSSRMSLGPIKSILKGSMNIFRRESIQSQTSTASSSNPSTRPSQVGFPTSSQLEDSNATQSMEITQDYQAPVHDNFSRKSMGRRVSFNERAQVRLFEKDLTSSSAGSGQSPHSSPARTSSDDDPPLYETPPPPVVFNDENDYPGRNQRRSSIRQSIMTDMDITGVFGGEEDESALMDEDLEFDEYDDDGMDMTEVIDGQIVRRRSSVANRRRSSIRPRVSVAANRRISDARRHSSIIRQPLIDTTSSILVSRPPREDHADRTQAMEMTVPLGHALNPADQDPTWLALKQMTHAGGESSASFESDDEEAIHAMEIQSQSIDDSMSSIGDESLSVDAQASDKTLNLSRILGRVSQGEQVRHSTGVFSDMMEESEIYGNIAESGLSDSNRNVETEPLPSGSTSQAPGGVPVPSPPITAVPSVFSRPPVSSLPKAPTNSRPTSPTKPKQFSAAFAPPVTRPSPKKSGSSAAVEPQQKRPRPSSFDHGTDFDETDRPSPPKRLVLDKKRPSVPIDLPSATSSIAKPKPLSPSKKAPFQAPTPAAPPTKPSSLRRPSGYFASRRSMGAALSATVPDEDQGAPTTTIRISPKKKSGLGLGRASVGSGQSDAWKRFDKNENAERKENEKAKEDHCVREAVRQAVASPTLTRGSPAPASPKIVPASSKDTPPTRSPSPQPAIDLSRILGSQLSEQEDVPMELDIEATQQWRNGVDQQELIEDDGLVISIENFLEMTGIKFMDELTAPRRSIYPTQSQGAQPRNSPDVPLSEYAIACSIEAPELVLYSRVSRDLEAWMMKSKTDFRQLEEEAEKITPELFVEYARADEESQAELRGQLQLIRTNTRGLAKADWYKWKLQWIDGLYEGVADTYKKLQADAASLSTLKAQADDALPALEREYEAITRELAMEQAEVAEIEQCDQQYLSELKASITDQNYVVEALRSETNEGKEQVKWLQSRIQEIGLEKQEAQVALSESNRTLHIQQHSTQTEVFRLQEELEILEDLHMCHIVKVTPNVFEYIYASQFSVVIPCRKFIPVLGKVEISELKSFQTKTKDDFPHLSRFLLSMAIHRIRQSTKLTTRQMIHALSDYWSACSQVRSQLRHLAVRYPVEIDVTAPSADARASFKLEASLLFQARKAKAIVSFVFAEETFAQWPVTLSTLRVEVDVAYGAIDRETILQAVTGRLSEASPSDTYACLLDACIEAQEKCGN